MKMKKIVALFLVAVLALVPLSVCTFAADNSTTITIFHTNDQHGRFVGDEKNGIVGIDRIAAVKDSVPNSILIDAGDAIHGLPIATLNKGEDAIMLMSKAGYDYMTTGNHDYNYGYQRLQELKDKASFKILASNVTKDGKCIFDDTDIKTINGVKIGFFGLATEETKSMTMPSNVEGLAFENAVDTAKARVSSLKQQGAQVIIAIAHLGVVENGATTSQALAQKTDGIDVIIDGHSHTVLEKGNTVKNTLIAQTGNYENNLGKIELIVDKSGKITSKKATLMTGADLLKQIQPKADVQKMLTDITAEQKTVLDQVVGKSGSSFSAERAPGLRTQEAPLGSLLADSNRAYAKADITICNGGSARADIKEGTLTKGDVISVLPFGNNVQVKKVTPVILKSALENGVSGIILNKNGSIDHEASAQGKFPQVSGFKYTYNPTLPAGSRIVDITLDNGMHLDLKDNTTQLTISGSNFLLSGGDGYEMFKSLPVYRELGAEDEALAQYIAEQGTITAPALGRITISTSTNPSTGSSYGAITMGILFLAVAASQAIVHNKRK